MKTPDKITKKGPEAMPEKIENLPPSVLAILRSVRGKLTVAAPLLLAFILTACEGNQRADSNDVDTRANTQSTDVVPDNYSEPGTNGEDTDDETDAGYPEDTSEGVAPEVTGGETAEEADDETDDGTNWDYNRNMTDDFHFALAACDDNHWNDIIVCQEQEDECLGGGNTEEHCQYAEQLCLSLADSNRDECNELAGDIVGCEFDPASPDADADNDGLTDRQEVNVTFTNPCSTHSCGPTADPYRDSDGDGIVDIDDPQPACRVGEMHCGIPLRPGTPYGNDGVVDSSCDLPEDFE